MKKVSFDSDMVAAISLEITTEKQIQKTYDEIMKKQM